MHDPKHKHSRRTFLKASAATLAVGGCSHAGPDPQAFHPTPTQLSMRKRGPSTVAVIGCDSYEEDLFKQLKQYITALSLPDLRNKKVLIKPNIVEYRADSPITTNPQMLVAAAQLADYLGAKEIIVGEGPGNVRDTDYLLEATGFGAVCKKLDLQFIDLNLDDLEKVENTCKVSKAPHFYLPKAVMEADAVISLPKLKTHHWAFVTASMKNLFGVVPGRKYGWPKNFLHINGITETIIDLVHLVKPSIGLVDAIVAMEGDGPINGRARQSSFMVLGTDGAAVDATCARAIGLDPFQVPYLKIADLVVGNVKEQDISLVGTPLESVKQMFDMAPTFKDRRLLDSSEQNDS